jgi:hypothetical protein
MSTKNQKKHAPPQPAPPAPPAAQAVKVKVISREINPEWHKISVPGDMGTTMARLHTPRRFARGIKLNSLMLATKPDHLDYYTLSNL